MTERSEATRAQLLAAAHDLFAERGYAGVGTEDVVRAAGLTRGALYHHFADKKALFAAALERVEQELVSRSAPRWPPRARAPRAKAPGAGAPGAGAPGAGAPGATGAGRYGTGRGTAREGTGREGTAPEGTAPEGTAREGTAPEGAGRKGTGPDGTAPDGTAPEGTGPEGTGPVGWLAAGMSAYLDACVRPAVLRISLFDAPTVLGWARWRRSTSATAFAW